MAMDNHGSPSMDIHVHGCPEVRGPRARRHHGGRWRVFARVERFTEPALLLLLRERPAHGYDLLERLPALTGEQRVEMGNLYRLLRALEEEGLVSSEWDAGKRTYTLTTRCSQLLDQWVDALRRSQERIRTFLDRYEEGR
jgi:PadR family transcriptional regulator PadR